MSIEETFSSSRSPSLLLILLSLRWRSSTPLSNTPVYAPGVPWVWRQECVRMAMTRTQNYTRRSLSWVIENLCRAEGGFIGSERVLGQLKNGPPRRRVGLIVENAPARQGTKILAPKTSEEIAIPPTPTVVGKNIAMGYVKSSSQNKGTALAVEVPKKARAALVTTMAFSPTRYWRG